MDRRNFLKKSAITATGLSLTPLMGKPFNSIFGQSAPSNKIKIGLIGCRNQGWSNLTTFLQYPNVECVSLCDIDDQWLYQRASELEEMTGKKPPQLVKDWRRVIDNKDVDMVIIGTPDHWHCLQTIAACEAGKDVFVEKPLANTIEECDLMVKAARKYNRIVQVGQWQRSDPHWDEAVLLALIIIGGIRRIASVTEKLVPFMAIIYFLTAIAIIASNYQNIIPSFLSIFENVFTGTSAIGGFLGAGFAFAFNNGVNRGLFSNEAGQGSAPIAHAAAKAHEPVSEGIVAILEPFIDTVIICFLTGMVILSSGVWSEKVPNQFQKTDIIVLAGSYTESSEDNVAKLSNYLNNKSDIPLYTGTLTVIDGKILDNNSIIHARSLAEDIVVKKGGVLYSGEIVVTNGSVADTPNDLIFSGKSLIHSAPLTTLAYTQSFLGESGKYVVAIGLLLFAFSTAIAWSYYGDRAITYLIGAKYVMIYRIIFVMAFFIASFVDTTIIWNLSMLTVAFMTVPNLIGLLILHKEVKSVIGSYWVDFRKEHPNVKVPKE
jgi:amino acid carrier protein